MRPPEVGERRVARTMFEEWAASLLEARASVRAVRRMQVAPASCQHSSLSLPLSSHSAERVRQVVYREPKEVIQESLLRAVNNLPDQAAAAQDVGGWRAGRGGPANGGAMGQEGGGGQEGEDADMQDDGGWEAGAIEMRDSCGGQGGCLGTEALQVPPAWLCGLATPSSVSASLSSLLPSRSLAPPPARFFPSSLLPALPLSSFSVFLFSFPCPLYLSSHTHLTSTFSLHFCLSL